MLKIYYKNNQNFEKKTAGKFMSYRDIVMNRSIRDAQEFIEKVRISDKSPN